MRTIDMEALVEAQIKEMLSPDNMWYTGEEVGHKPTPDEAAQHYIENGGAENFRKNHGNKFIIKK